MFLAPSIILGLLLALLFGGKPSRLGSIRFRHSWAVVVAFAVQLALFLPGQPPASPRVLSLINACTYVLLLWFAARNFHLRTLWPVLIGLALNTAAILANGGRMPVSSSAADAADLGAMHSVSSSATHLRLLGDVFALPKGVPFANVFSVGDAFIGIGMIAFIVLVSVDRGGERALSVRRLGEPMRSAAFRRLALGKLISQTGDWLTFAVLVSWTYERTGSTGSVAAFLLLRLLPPVIGGGLAAYVVDRLPKQRLLVWIELARGVFVAAALGGVAAGNLGAVFLAFAGSGILAAVSGATAPSLLPSLVHESQLASANATIGLAKDAAMAVGALAGGVMLTSVGPESALALDLVTFALAAAVFLGIRPRHALPRTASRNDVQRPAALTYLLTSRSLFVLVASFAVATIATGLTNATLPRLLTSLGFGQGGYGFGLGALAVGLALGETVVGLARLGPSAGRWVGVGLIVMAGLFVLLALETHAPSAILFIAGIGFVDGTTDVIFDTAIQREADPRRYGAVFGLASASFTATMLVAVAVAPLANRFLEPRGVLLVAAGFLVVAGTIALIRLRIGAEGHSRPPARGDVLAEELATS
jgi:Family of unknown function (DUF5317)/Major Facilitator Superfamily